MLCPSRFLAYTEMHVLDGNNIAATEHRLKETRANLAPLLCQGSLCAVSSDQPINW